MSRPDLTRLASALMCTSYYQEIVEDAKDRAYIAKIEREKEQARYRQSKEYRDARAKKRAQRKLRKKVKGGKK